MAGTAASARAARAAPQGRSAATAGAATTPICPPAWRPRGLRRRYLRDGRHHRRHVDRPEHGRQRGPRTGRLRRRRWQRHAAGRGIRTIVGRFRWARRLGRWGVPRRSRRRRARGAALERGGQRRARRRRARRHSRQSWRRVLHRIWRPWGRRRIGRRPRRIGWRRPLAHRPTGRRQHGGQRRERRDLHGERVGRGLLRQRRRRRRGAGRRARRARRPDDPRAGHDHREQARRRRVAGARPAASVLGTVGAPGAAPSGAAVYGAATTRVVGSIFAFNLPPGPYCGGALTDAGNNLDWHGDPICPARASWRTSGSARWLTTAASRSRAGCFPGARDRRVLVHGRNRPARRGAAHGREVRHRRLRGRGAAAVGGDRHPHADRLDPERQGRAERGVVRRLRLRHQRQVRHHDGPHRSSPAAARHRS